MIPDITININLYYVYALVDPRDDKIFYIGKGKKYRYLSHEKENRNNSSNIYKFNKIQKIKNTTDKKIKYLFLHYNIEDENKAYCIEEYYISHYGIKSEGGILTNICKNNRPPDCTGRTVSLETRKKIGEKQLGNKNHMFGKKQSEKSNNKRRLYNLKYNIRPPINTGHSEETIKKIRESNTGKTHSEETKQKLKEVNSIEYILHDKLNNTTILLFSYELKEYCITNKLNYTQLCRRSRNNKLYKKRYLISKVK